ncbi:MAG: NERD domain-containing protein [Nitrososphaerota archaeon]|nr:NERD domain-containing protein [Nitrososphaerota archaeon]
MPLSVFSCGSLDFPPERRQMDSLLAYLDRWCAERGTSASIVVDVELKEKGETQTEAVVFAFNRAFIIELKHFQGRISANQNGAGWLVDDGSSAPYHTPSNPFKQARRHRYLVGSHFLRLLYPTVDPELWDPDLTGALEDPRSKKTMAMVRSWIVVEPGTWVDYGDINTTKVPWFRVTGLEEVSREMERESMESGLPPQLAMKFVDSLNARPVSRKDWMRISPPTERTSPAPKRSETLETMLRSRDEHEKLKGLSLVSELGLHGELPEIIDIARCGLPEPRRRALTLLDSWGSPALREWAQAALSEKNLHEKEEALSWVAARPSQGYIPAIREIAFGVDGKMRREAITVLSKLPWDEATRSLLDLGRRALNGLANLDVGDWTALLKGIGRPGFSDATEVVDAFLVPGAGALRWLDPCDEETLLGNALEAARGIGNPILLGKVIPLLTWNEGDLIHSALHAIADLAGPDELDLLLGYLRSEDEWLQLYAIRGLGRVGGERAFDKMLGLFVETLSRDRLSRELGEALFGVDPVSFCNVVANFLADPHGGELEGVSDLLWVAMNMADSQLVEAAFPYLQYPQTWMDACNMVSNKGVWPTVREKVRTLLVDGNEYERSAAILAMSSLEGVVFEQELRSYENDPSEVVQSHIIDAYGYFKSAYAESRIIGFTVSQSPKIVRDAIWELEHNADWFRYDVATVGLKDTPMSGTVVIHRTGIYFHDEETGLALPIACVKQIVEVHPVRGRPGLVVDGDSPHLPRIFTTPGDHTDYLWADRTLDEWVRHVTKVYPTVRFSGTIDEGLDPVVRELYSRLATLGPESSDGDND